MRPEPSAAATWSRCAAPAEILATLDEHGAIDGLPFMAEMVAYLRPALHRRAPRRQDLRHDRQHAAESADARHACCSTTCAATAAAHGGCQADCRFYWNEAWLKQVDALVGSPRRSDDGDVAALLARTRPQRAARAAHGEGDEVRWTRAR